jgi:hypothetical protein
LSINVPTDSGREYVAPNRDLVFQTADEVGILAIIRKDTRHGLAVLGYHQAVSVELIQKGQALFLEFCGSYSLQSEASLF